MLNFGSQVLFNLQQQRCSLCFFKLLLLLHFQQVHQHRPQIYLCTTSTSRSAADLKRVGCHPMGWGQLYYWPVIGRFSAITTLSGLWLDAIILNTEDIDVIRYLSCRYNYNISLPFVNQRLDGSIAQLGSQVQLKLQQTSSMVQLSIKAQSSTQQEWSIAQFRLQSKLHRVLNLL